MEKSVVKDRFCVVILRKIKNNSQFSILNYQLIFLLFLPCIVFAQSSEHSASGVDSLEQILATNPPTGAELMLTYRNLMYGYLENNTEKSMEYAQKCMETAIPLDDWRFVSDSYTILAINFYIISQYDSAMVCYNKALDTAERMRDVPEKYTEKQIDIAFSYTYGNMGNFYNILGKYHEAIDCYIKALRIFEKYDWKENQSIAYQGIGALYLSMDNYEQAKNYFMKLDSLAQLIGNPTRIAAAKEQFSLLYLSTKDYTQALQNAEEYYKLTFSDPEVGKEYQARALNMLSQIYLEGFDDEARAEEYAKQALQTLDTRNIPREIAASLRILSMLHLRRGEWWQAEKTALEAIKTDDSEPAGTLVLYEILAKVYAHQGNAAKSVEYFDKHNALQSSWATKNYQSAMRDMEVKYETEKKENEIERQRHVISRANMQRGMLAAGIVICALVLVLLWYMLRMRTRHNLALADMNATKDKFFSIISHDLKNPAVTQRDALRSLVNNGRLWDVDTLSDYYSELLNSAEGEVELIYNLLDWARIQTGRMTYTSEPFNLSTRLRTDITLARTMSEKKGVSFLVEVPDTVEIVGNGNLLSTVVRNLLTNAVKFTAEGGQVTLNIFPCGTTGYIISVSDTGTGMNEEQKSNLFRLDSTQSREGTSGEPGSGLGLIVCKELLEKNGMVLHVESEEGKGSRFWFEVKGND